VGDRPRSASSSTVGAISSAQRAGWSGAADHDLDAVPQTGLLQGLDRLLLVGHRRRQQAEQSRSGLELLDLATKLSIGTSQPTSVTAKPAAESIEQTIVLPISWMSPATVPATAVPRDVAPAGGVDGRLQDGHGRLSSPRRPGPARAGRTRPWRTGRRPPRCPSRNLCRGCRPADAGVEALPGQGGGIVRLSIDDGLAILANSSSDTANLPRETTSASGASLPGALPRDVKSLQGTNVPARGAWPPPAGRTPAEATEWAPPMQVAPWLQVTGRR